MTQGGQRMAKEIVRLLKTFKSAYEMAADLRERQIAHDR
jgi:hypothetical protein